MPRPLITFAISTRLCTVSLSMCAFEFAHHHPTSTPLLLQSSAVLACFCLVERDGEVSFTDTASLVLLGACLTPVLGALTASYADNAIEVMTNAAFVLHLFAMDAARDGQSPVSMNAALASTLLRASRLGSPELSFAFSITSVLLMVCLPARAGSRRGWFAVVDWGIIPIAIAARWVWFGWTAAVGLSVLVFCTAVVAPWVLNRIPNTKLSGPWDLLHVSEDLTD